MLRLARAVRLFRPAATALAALPWLWVSSAAAKPTHQFEAMSASAKTDAHTKGITGLREAWSAFADGWLLLDMVVVLLLALLLGAVIAYHPSARRRVTSLEQFEQPKTLLLYSVVAAVVALIVEVQPAMAFVIFGIGGLLRFRTEVGEAKDTGRVILVTVLGLCCGLKIFIVALPATVIGWLLIYALEMQPAGIIRVSGVGEHAMHAATQAYRAKISAAGFTIIGEQTKFIKREFVFVVKAPPLLDRESLRAEFDRMPPEVRGVVDWERI
ncbi:MAG TPA: hypothetical protein VFQ61_00710 [Polyangiaceae bacterium]|nr:hypothetical protein [Polyangiaceae bacterium]